MDVTVRQIADATRGSSWEGNVYLVGGAVRDERLGEPAERHDFDLVVTTDAGALAEFLYRAGVSKIPPVTYPRFGTAMVIVGEAMVEIVTARKESYSQDSRKPEVQAASLREDAERRDFTINTLLRNIHTGELLDLLGSGLADLAARVLRTPLDPDATFTDDPLRMMRAVRFKARFSMRPAPGLIEAIRRNVDRLRIVSSERIAEELSKTLTGPAPDAALADMMELGLLSTFAPEFAEGIGIDQGTYHSKDVWGHTLDVVAQASASPGRSLVVMLAALLHDVGKPRTRSVEADGRVRFFGHEEVGAEIARDILQRLRFPNEVVDSVVALVKNHMRLGSAVPFTASAARRLRRDLGDLVEPLLSVCEADASALARIPKGIDFAAVRQKLSEVEHTVQNRRFDSPLSGDDIMALTGLPQGAEVGRLKRMLSDAVVDGRIGADDRDAAAALLREAVE